MTKLPKIKHLICSCCGSETMGRQWHNRDTGYGLCPDCVERCKKGETDESFRQLYGENGAHYNIKTKSNNKTSDAITHKDILVKELTMPEIENTVENENKSWDIKTIKIALGEDDDDHGFMEAEIFNGIEFSISFTARTAMSLGENGEKIVENMPIDAARRLRDFLNYAIPKDMENQ